MKRIFTVITSLIILSVPVPGISGQNDSDRHSNRSLSRRVSSFVGLWETVDPADGGHQIISITPLENGEVNILLRDTFFTLCDGTDQGFSQGTGFLTDNGTLRSDDLTLTCFNNGSTLATPTSFQLKKVRHGRTILLRDRAEPLSDVVYHRTSN